MPVRGKNFITPLFFWQVYCAPNRWASIPRRHWFPMRNATVWWLWALRFNIRLWKHPWNLWEHPVVGWLPPPGGIPVWCMNKKHPHPCLTPQGQTPPPRIGVMVGWSLAWVFLASVGSGKTLRNGS
jgi:hypothetical protein